MGLTFRPAVYKGGELFELPRPITQVRILDRWDFERLKVLLSPGDYLTGHSRHGIEISIEGQFGSHEGSLSLTEEEMFVVWEGMREMLDVTEDSEKFEFFLYHEGSDGSYRKLKECSTVRLECDMSNKHLFEYAVTIHADDSSLYPTAPGA